MQRRWRLGLVLISLCLMVAFSATAEQVLQTELTASLDVPAFQGLQRMTSDPATAHGKATGWAATSMGNDRYHLLFLLQQQEGTWRVESQNMLAVYQNREVGPRITIRDMGKYDSLTMQASDDLFSETYTFTNQKGAWTLESAELWRADEEPIHVNRTGDGGLMFFSDEGMVTLPIGEDLKLCHFDISSFPKNMAAAQRASDALAMWDADLPGGVTVTVDSLTVLPVYTGPSEAYHRAGDGRASLSTAEPFVQYGEEDGWLLVQYQMDGDRQRYGYVQRQDAMAFSVSPLSLAEKPAVVNIACALTDDPLSEESALMQLELGVQVTFLGLHHGQWAYVETITQAGAPVRGFVPAEAISVL